MACTSSEAAGGAGCVFQSKIPSVRLYSVCKYTCRLMTTPRSSRTRGLNNSCLAGCVVPLFRETPLNDGQHSRTGSILSSSPTLHVPVAHLGSLLKYLYLGWRNTAEATNLRFPFPHESGGKKNKHYCHLQASGGITCQRKGHEVTLP